MTTCRSRLICTDQQLDLVPVFQFGNAVADIRCDLRTEARNSSEPSLLTFVERAFRNDQRGLEVVAARNHVPELCRN